MTVHFASPEMPELLTGAALYEFTAAVAEDLPHGWTVAPALEGTTSAFIDGPDGQQLRVSPAREPHRVEVAGLFIDLPDILFDSNPNRLVHITVTTKRSIAWIASKIEARLLDHPDGYTARHRELRQLAEARNPDGLYVHLDYHLRDAITRRDDAKLAGLADDWSHAGNTALAEALRAAGSEGLHTLLISLRVWITKPNPRPGHPLPQ